MGSHDFPYLALLRVLDDGSVLSEALLNPELLRMGQSPNGARRALVRALKARLERMHPRRLGGREAPEGVERSIVTIEVPPPRKSTAWRRSLALEFPVVRWVHGNGPYLAYVPDLNLPVLADTPEELEARLPAAIRSELARRGAKTVERLAVLQRTRDLHLEEASLGLHVRSLKERAREAREGKPKRSELRKVATDLTSIRLRPAWERDADVARLADRLTRPSPRSVLLVGPSGVGKTAVVHELVRRRSKFRLGSTPFFETSGARLVAGMTGFGMWQERCGRVWREASHLRAVLVLGNLVELVEVGQYEGNAQGVAGYFRPYLSRGDLLAVAECTPEQLTLLERDHPQLVAAFTVLPVEPPPREAVLSILLQASLARGASPEVEALEHLEALHRRHATYSAPPGRPLRFLDALLREHPRATPADVSRAFSDETGLPLFLVEESEPLHLHELWEFFATRVVGQPEAVDLAVDLLATIKAGLSRPGRPLASLLFVGPTGVGKTEMARTMAELLFRDRERITRFDMSEYSDPRAVLRLTAGRPGGEGLLTAAVREQPFGVVLFDELEKADPSFFDLLLQVLGEARLTDAGGRLADFSNALVVMTSNLGADRFRQGPLGLRTDREEASSTFLQAVRQAMRPELYNRLDRVVPFAPLDRATVEVIARRELELLGQRDGLRYRDLRLDLGPDLAAWLARVGYHRAYGARPLKRAVERQVLAPLAARVNRYDARTPLEARVEVRDERVEVQVKARPEGGPPPRGVARQAGAFEGERLAAASLLRRKVGRLVGGPAALELHNTLFRLRRRPRERRPLEVLAERMAALEAVARGVEEDFVLALHGYPPAGEGSVHTRLDVAQADFLALALDLYARRFDRPHQASLALLSEDSVGLFDLARAYWKEGERRGFEGEALRLEARRVKDDPGLDGRWVREPGAFLKAPKAGVLGLVLGFRGRHALPRLAGESGLHLLVDGAGGTRRVLVLASDALLGDLDPPAGAHRRGFVGPQERRRTYDARKRTVADVRFSFGWDGRSLDEALSGALEASLALSAEAEVAP